MRALGIVFLFLGFVAVVVGTFSGCGSLFSWNGRHPVDTVVLQERSTQRPLKPVPGRRYTLSVQVVFDRESVETREGVAIVEAKFPIVVRVTDRAGTSMADTKGWLDPNEPPSVLYGQSVSDARAAHTELVVERLIGPFLTASDGPLTVSVDLGPDAVAEGRRARVTERRLIVYDDALPPTIRNAFVLAAVGAFSFVAGLALVIVGWFRSRGRGSSPGRRKRGGIPGPNVV